MDSLSDIIRGELDSVTSTDSLQLITDEYWLKHMSTPDVSNIELSKRVALLELENERLRIDLENVRIELNARIAANEGLKGKISELYVEVQTVLQEKLKLQNTLTETTNRLSIMESSTKWYQGQLHNVQANRKALQIEVNTYQKISKQHQQTLVNITTKYKQLVTEHSKLEKKYQEEKSSFNKLKETENKNIVLYNHDSYLTSESNGDLSTKLEVTEGELQDTKAELKILEQRLLSIEVAKMSMENVISKQQALIASMEKNLEKWDMEKNETADKLCKTEFEVQKLKTENENLKTNFLSTTMEQSQLGDATMQLQTQLTKMIAQYKLVKTRNAEVEEKLNTMEDLANENKRLKKLSYEANSSLIRKLMQEKRKTKILQNKLQCEQSKKQYLPDIKNLNDCNLRMYLKHAVSNNKDLKDQLKSLAKSLDENVDEGYGDSSILSSISIDIPNTISNNSVLLNSAAQAILRSKQFAIPLEKELNLLDTKIKNIRDQYAQTMEEETCLL